MRMMACALVLGLAGAAGAQEMEFRPAEAPVAFHTGSGAELKNDGVLEASAVEPIGDDGKYVLVAHDKHPALYIAETATGRIVGKPILTPAFPTNLAVGPKWEGMARDDAGNYYVIGSHSGKTDDERRQRAYLFRFRLKGAGESTTIDEASVARWGCARGLADALAAEVSDPAARARLKIEGLTVRKSGEKTELVVGLREPLDRVRVYATDLIDTASTETELKFRPLFSFVPGSREGTPFALTSLEYAPQWKGFFVVTATEDEANLFHGNALWFVSDDSIAAGRVEPVKAAEFEPAMKCEGLALLPGATDKQLNVVLTYDNDGHTTKMPSRIQTVKLSRK